MFVLCLLLCFLMFYFFFMIPIGLFLREKYLSLVVCLIFFPVLLLLLLLLRNPFLLDGRVAVPYGHW